MGWPKGVSHSKESNSRRSETLTGLKRSYETIKRCKIAAKIRWKTQGYREKFRKSTTGENHAHWLGENVSKGVLHKWLARWYGKADRCENINCPDELDMFDWANLSGEYKRDRADFIRLCRLCHIRFDRCSMPIKIKINSLEVTMIRQK